MRPMVRDGLRPPHHEVARFQRLSPHGEPVEPWAASFFRILLAAATRPQIYDYCRPC
jgi:hypothetical protein